jgi:Ca2+-binding RTX toxin-like protein
MLTHETLESRRLLSVNVAFDTANGLLEVNGGRIGDNIRVTATATQQSSPTMHQKHRPVLNIKPGPSQPGVSVYDDGRLIYNSVQAGQNVRTVEVYGNDGFDSIDVTSFNTAVITRVFGGPGDDWIGISASQTRAPQVDAGDGDDLVHAIYGYEATLSGLDGGAGNDSIYVLAHVVSPDTVTNSAILGGEGDDLITLAAESGEKGFLALGGAGGDTIYGSAKADQLAGEDGDDLIFAGDGNDFIYGGVGDDQLFGEQGDDYLDHGGGVDLVDGGDGYDVALAGDEDKVFGIEAFI